jgi:hypothetical protein
MPLREFTDSCKPYYRQKLTADNYYGQCGACVWAHWFNPRKEENK